MIEARTHTRYYDQLGQFMNQVVLILVVLMLPFNTILMEKNENTPVSQGESNVEKKDLLATLKDIANDEMDGCDENDTLNQDEVQETKDSDLEDGYSPEFNDEFYSQLPSLLRKPIVACEGDSERRMILMASLTLLSGMMPNTFGYYDGEVVYPNLYLYVVGKAGSGKGKLSFPRRLVNPVNAYLQNRGINTDVEEENETLLEQVLANATEGQMEEETSNFDLIIPANNSASGFYYLLGKNDGQGILFETESDSIANTLNKDYGDYSDALRKAFQHEELSYYRKTEDKRIRMKNPKLTVLLSSTPRQLKRFIPDAENGLFSRFMFFITDPEPGFRNVFGNGNKHRRAEAFERAANEYVELFQLMERNEAVEFMFSDDQQESFLKVMGKIKGALTTFNHEDLDASANRMGLCFFRMAMILSRIRAMENGNTNPTLACSDVDFEIAMKLMEMSVDYMVQVFEILPNKGMSGYPISKSQTYFELPDEFTTGQAVEIGVKNGMSARTVKRFLNDDLFERLSQGKYRKAELS